jgi:hypothetical protein
MTKQLGRLEAFQLGLELEAQLRRFLFREPKRHASNPGGGQTSP